MNTLPSISPNDLLIKHFDEFYLGMLTALNTHAAHRAEALTRSETVQRDRQISVVPLDALRPSHPREELRDTAIVVSATPPQLCPGRSRSFNVVCSNLTQLVILPLYQPFLRSLSYSLSYASKAYRPRRAQVAEGPVDGAAPSTFCTTTTVHRPPTTHCPRPLFLGIMSKCAGCGEKEASRLECPSCKK